jgi:hypothetical protein
VRRLPNVLSQRVLFGEQVQVSHGGIPFGLHPVVPPRGEASMVNFLLKNDPFRGRRGSRLRLVRLAPDAGGSI